MVRGELLDLRRRIDDVRSIVVDASTIRQQLARDSGGARAGL